MTFLQHLLEYRTENQQFSHGLDQVLNQAILYSFIYSNFRYREEFLFLLDEERPEIFNEDLLGLNNLLAKSLPYCILTPESMQRIYDYIKVSDTLSPEFVISIRLLLKNYPRLINAWLKFFRTKEIYIDILGYCYIEDYEVKGRKLVLKDKENQVSRLFAISQIIFKDHGDKEAALSLVKQNWASSPIMAIRAVGNVINQCAADSILIAPCLDLIRDLLDYADINLFTEMIYWIQSVKSNKIRLILILKDYIRSRPEIITECLPALGQLLSHGEEKSVSVDLFLHLAEVFSHPDQIKSFHFFIRTLHGDLLSHLVIGILNSDNGRVNKLIQDISLLKLNEDLTFSVSDLNKVDYKDLVYILNKVIAYVFSSENLTTLCFSVLKSQHRQQVQPMVVAIFTDVILFNYREPLKYLKEKERNGDAFERATASIILNRHRAFWDSSNEVPYIEELKIPTSRIRTLTKMRAVNFSKNQKATGHTPLLDLVTKIDLRAGGSFTTRNSHGGYSKSAGMSKITKSFELPQGSFLDPISQYFIQLRAIKYKRGS